jgi:D-glycero-D-manno-heptose 1,7-bisphosphate phosphatase
MTLRPGSGQDRGAVFLDRDGTLIEEVGYLDRAERVELYPWSIDAVRALNRAGFRVVMVSNQSGVARGFFTEAVVEAVHAHIADLLEAGGARIDAYYYCPHHPDGKVKQYAQPCECRKPGRGLVDRAARELGISPAASFVVGDRWLDVALARAIGGRGVLVRTGYGATEETRAPEGLRADAIVDNLIGAVSWILRNA